MIRTVGAVFAILVGLGIAVTWIGWYAAGTLPEIDSRSIRTAFHIGAEGIAALALAAGGIAVLARRRWGRPLYLAALGLGIYAGIEGAGHYASIGDGAMLAATVATAVAAAAFIAAEILSAD